MGCSASRKTKGAEPHNMEINTSLKNEINENKETVVEKAKEVKNNGEEFIRKQVRKEESTLADKVNKNKREIQKETDEHLQNATTKHGETQEEKEMNDAPDKDESSLNIETGVDITNASNEDDPVDDQGREE